MERIEKECIEIKLQEWKRIFVPSQIYQGIVLFFILLQKKNEKEWKEKTIHVNGNLF